MTRMTPMVPTPTTPNVSTTETQLQLDIVQQPDGSYAISGFDSFDLHATCQCGQAFRWVRVGDMGGIEEGIVEGHLLRLEQRGGKLIVHPPADRAAVDVVIRYFRLTDSHDAIERVLESVDDVMAAAVSASRGLRLVAQHPWECLISYILSANNSVQQISRVVENLSYAYGEPTAGDGPHYSPRRAFPTPEALARCGECDVRSCKAGFRARGVCEAAQRVAYGHLDLSALRRLPTHQARNKLMELRGVGNKVADCVLLFSLDRFEVFPVDVWIGRAVRRLYFGGEPAPLARIREFASTRFGPLAGYAQEYLFNYARKHIPEILRAD